MTTRWWVVALLTSALAACGGATVGSGSGRDLVLVRDDGGLAAVEAATGRGAYPGGRADTDIVVAGRGSASTFRHHLPGNLVPEAFSTDGRALFVIQYSPPLAPDRYRVRRLDVQSGRLDDVASPDKDLQE